MTFIIIIWGENVVVGMNDDNWYGMMCEHVKLWCLKGILGYDIDSVCLDIVDVSKEYTLNSNNHSHS